MTQNPTIPPPRQLFGLTYANIVITLATIVLVGLFVYANACLAGRWCSTEISNGLRGILNLPTGPVSDISSVPPPPNTPTVVVSTATDTTPPTATNTARHTSTATSPSPTATGTETLTPTLIATPTVTTPSATLTPTITLATATAIPTITITATSTPLPTITSTLTDTPTPTETIALPSTSDNITAKVVIDGTSNLMLRRGPAGSEGIIERLPNGTVISITGKTIDSNWYQVETPSGNKGWVSAEYVFLENSEAFDDIQYVEAPLLTQTKKPIVPNEVFFLDVGANVIYNFIAEEDVSRIIVAIRPNANAQGLQVTVEVNRITPTGERDNAGSGGEYSQFPADLSGLSWQGGQRGQQYEVTITNNSNSDVGVCLTREEVAGWVCEQ